MMPVNRTRALALGTTLLALLVPSVADAKPKAVPLPPAGWTVVHDEAAVENVRSTTSATTAYAYADVAANRVVTSTPLGRYETAHEVGHLFDWHVLTDADRAYVAAMLHVRGEWFGWRADGNGAEVFADYYAAAAIGLDPRPRRVRGGGIVYGDGWLTYAHVGYARLQRFRWFLAGVAAREGLRSGVITAAH